MNKIFIILAFFISTSIASSQGVFTFEEAVADYSIIIRDSSKIDVSDHDMTSDLFWGGWMLPDGENVYLVFRDMLTTFGGTYIEKRNMNSGELIWWSTTGYARDSIREDVCTFYINADRELDVTYYGEIQYFPYPPFLGDCQPLARVYDGETGEIINVVSNESNSIESDGLLDWKLTTRDLFRTETGYSRIKLIPNQEPLDYDFQIKKYDHNLDLVSIDTVYFDRDRRSYESRGRTIQLDDRFVKLRRSSEYSIDQPKEDGLFADYTAYFDFYSSDFEYEYSRDISGIVPYYWEFNSPRKMNDLILLSTRDSVDIGVISYRAFTYFDKEGELVKIDNFSNIPTSAMYVANIPNTNQHIYLSERFVQPREFYWDFYQSDGNGNITRLNTITPKNGDIYGNVSDIMISEDLQVLVRYAYFGYDDIVPGTNSGFSNYALTAIAASDIGLIPVSTKDVQQDEMQHVFEVSPNPAISHAVLTFDKAVSGTLSIRSIDGRLQSTSTISQQQEYILDVSAMPSGTYLVTFEDTNEVTDTQRLVVNYNR